MNSDIAIPNNKYYVKVYTKYGYFEYTVKEMSSAIEHAQLIMERGVYRRSNLKGEVEFHKVIKTKVCGDGLQSEYLDTFKRT